MTSGYVVRVCPSRTVTDDSINYIKKMDLHVKSAHTLDRDAPVLASLGSNFRRRNFEFVSPTTAIDQPESMP